MRERTIMGIAHIVFWSFLIWVLTTTILLFASTATAQVNGVVLTGNEGVITAVEYDGRALVRGGVVSRQGGRDYDWMASLGKRWGDRLTADAALDMERMHPRLRDMNPGEPVDFRARVGVGWGLTARAALAAEWSRSFHNETTTGRWMWGVRFGF